ncbi:hypothetical protein ABZ612_27925 [Streptomyces avermitilis]|uniref:hypothetical protein n=1 Tax=Streptomyces avermitilis TaxID=33903 RepID=UPI0033E24404
MSRNAVHCVRGVPGLRLARVCGFLDRLVDRFIHGVGGNLRDVFLGFLRRCRVDDRVINFSTDGEGAGVPSAANAGLVSAVHSKRDVEAIRTVRRTAISTKPIR